MKPFALIVPISEQVKADSFAALEQSAKGL